MENLDFDKLRPQLAEDVLSEQLIEEEAEAIVVDEKWDMMKLEVRDLFAEVNRALESDTGTDL